MAEERNIEDVLAEVAEQAEQTRDTFTKLYRSKRPPTDASQVYSIRIPVSRLDKIRSLAARYRTPPTSMLRRWILERLALEEGGAATSHSEFPVTALMTHLDESPTARAVVFYSFHHDDARAASSGRDLERELRQRIGERQGRMAGV